MDPSEHTRCKMVALLVIFCVCFGSFHPSLAQDTPASKVYFNVSSTVTIGTVLDLQSPLGTWLNFRTCDEGEILTQTGFNGDTFTLSVTPSGYIRAAWTVGAISKSAEVGPDYATNSKWVLLSLRYILGGIVLTVDSNLITLASASLNSELFEIDLSGGGDEVVLGTDFVGCMEQVTGLPLDSATSWNNVNWGVCPLELQQGCQPSACNDPCYTLPCKNNGVCSRNAQAPCGYLCDCTARYDGVNCELDKGPLCISPNTPEYHLDCQNGGVCVEDAIGNSTYCQCSDEYEGTLCERNVTYACDADACQNNATCLQTDNGVQCICADGFSGDNCAININECAVHQCLNGGLCIDGIADYTCNCTGTGYTGDRCSEPVDECLTEPCLNSVDCVDTSGDFVCICLDGWTGKICDEDLDECMSFPCINDGTCMNLNNAYECQCVQGFNGTNCDNNMDDCVSVTCPDTFECVDGVDAYTCECPPGKTNQSGSCVDIDECSPNPCLNGNCENLDNMYNCVCYPGFNGTNCEINIDECDSDPCLMNSTCVDGINDFNCTCLPGFDGELCDVDIDECSLDPCQNGASCVDGINSYTCECVLGYDGDRCENNIDDCAPDPCQNGADCEDKVNDYTCDCVLGYEDKNCSTNTNECDPDPCQNNGVCVDLVGDFQCNCTIDYVGKMCETLYDACVDKTPCENGATCTTPPLPSQDYNCTCVPGYSGTNCEINIDDCVGVDCNVTSGKICFDLVDGYNCACLVGYEDPLCSVDIDECASNPCRNNATCNESIGAFNCTCAPGFAGEQCEDNINECDPNPCQNGGRCEDEINGYRCFCVPGHSGLNCEVSLNECNSDPCKNGATCMDALNDVICTCVPGFTDKYCGTNIDECEQNMCQNNSTCIDGINEYTCNCAPGYNGTNCEIDIDECAVNPCNLGTCIDAVNDYTCNCTDTGFFGPQCESNIDDCAPDPCVNDATCADLIKDYNCSCWRGYEGKNCEVDVNECQDAPCLFGGVCYQRSNQSLYNGVNPLFPGQFSYANASGFLCQCADGYKGTTCEIDIDECASGPCANNGTCNDGVNGYTCECAGGWEGDDCKLEIDECLPVPCKNGATCTDLINDYECICTEEYGGSNCTVQLTGCDMNNCLNDATCIPSYDEATGDHTYTCQCTDGYNGTFCQTDTSVSFENEAFLEDPSTYLATTLDYSLSLQTTLPDGLLLYSGPYPNVKYFLLEMFNGELLLKYFQSGQPLIEINDFGQTINDGEYHTVRVIVTSQTITLSVTIPQATRTRRTATCSGGVCKQEVNIPTGVSVLFDEMYIGGVPDDDKTSVLPLSQSGVYFTGCMRDIKNGGSYIVPASTRAAVAPSVCRRVNQCPDDRCSNNGVCTDRWNTFTCVCNIGYTGTTCNESFIPATFRFEDIPESFAEFTANDVLSNSFSSVKLAFRTREPDGLIFYTEDTPSNSYITVELVSESLRVAVSRSGSLVSSTLGSGLSDGIYHFVSITADQTELSVSLDPLTSPVTDTQALTSGNPDFTVFNVGGVVDFAVIPADAATPDTYFKGCLWDVKFNNYSLQFEPLDLPSFPIPSFPMTTNSSVLINECQSDDTCADSPCENGGTCNVTWNDFECECPTGFGGKNCSDLTICATDPCPTGADCRDVPNGHECVVEATFDGTSSLVSYTSNISDSTNLNSITLKARTRNDAGIIYHSSNNLTDYFVTLYLVQGRPALRFNLGQFEEITSQVVIKDGSWHDIEVRFATDTVEIIVDKVSASKSTVIDSDLLALVITETGSSPVFLAGTTVVNSDYFVNYNYFKGCLNDVRVGGVLLPFYDRETVNSTSYDQFYATITDVNTSCVGDKTVCDSYSCNNFGTCVDLWNAASCQCLSGFDGDRCQIDIDECEMFDNPCVSGSTCRDDVNNYTCLCQSGFEGRDCGSEINECDPDPCLQGSVCYDGLDFFNCTCLGGYIGALCDVLINETCAGNPCKNNATCQDSAPGSEASFACECPTGFNGDDCGHDIDYCVAHECANGATCNSLRDQANYSCSCADGYSGNRCETNEDNCVGVDCQNGGNCVDEIDDFYCNCTGGYDGDRCQNDINECNPNPCQFGATCNDLPNDFNCVCTSGFDGRFCSDDINECLNTQDPPCQNGGTCMNTWGSYNCSCPADTYGSGCQTTPCDPSPCENNATCTALPPGVHDCLCPLGYVGVNCSVASCSNVVCQNGGSCQLSDASWECKCPEFTAGPLCQYKGPCAPDIAPCVNGGSCDQTFQDGGSFTYMCICPIGFNGTNCELEIDWCDSNPCQHEGSNCTSTREGFNCSCGPGYKGTFCEEKLPDCASNLCQNNATCEDLDYGYKCHCPDGYSGTDCAIDIDECFNEPCANGGSCTDAVNDFICICNGTGYQGKNCSEDVDECLSSPCLNDGTCTNKPGTFECTCKDGWLIPHCHLPDLCFQKPCENGGICENIISPDGMSVEKECYCNTDYDGPDCEKFIGNPTNWALIGGVTGGAVLLLIIVIILGIFLVKVKNKRATRGTYSPSRQEISGSRVEMDNILKLPPEERLI
ncbi:protein crumbs-like isoform X2 [Patiria miniata]|uniref:Uncharacterized protein n=1 Tax=Patiria miniata TaxID=46514 RepID=A0A914AII1_PATMI|nr:protein crumbs-like isoform X2 [Patiria miniata]